VEKAYAAWRGFQERLLAPVAAVLFVGSTLLALLEVGRRYVFGYSFEWQQDAVTYFVLSGVFLYFSISQRREAHLTVTLIPELFNVFGGRWRLAGVPGPDPGARGGRSLRRFDAGRAARGRAALYPRPVLRVAAGCGHLLHPQWCLPLFQHFAAA